MLHKLLIFTGLKSYKVYFFYKMFLLFRVDQATGQTQEAARSQAAPTEFATEPSTNLPEEISEKDLEREVLETETPEAPEAAVEATEAAVEAQEAPHLAEDAESRIKEVSNEPQEQPKNAFDVMKKATAVKPTGMDGHRYPKTGHFFGLHAL
jgi:hypothetical protein